VIMDEGSTATVTFLFSDVEGSTALLRRLRDGYRAVLDDHQQLLRAAWADAGGRELDADGDSFFVAFRRPRQAVDAAVAAVPTLTGAPGSGGTASTRGPLTFEDRAKGLLIGAAAVWAAFYVSLLVQIAWYAITQPWIAAPKPF